MSARPAVKVRGTLDAGAHASRTAPWKDVINEALPHGLALMEARQPVAYTFRLETVEGRVLPGVDLADRDKLVDLMERG
jgi:hypothetical protein